MGRTSTAEKSAAESLRHGSVDTGAEGAVFEPGASAAGPVAFDAAEIAEQLGLYWKSGDGDNFWINTETGEWSRWSLTATVDYVRKMSPRLIAIKAREGEILSEAKELLLHARLRRMVEAVFPSLPGYRSGIHRLDSGEKVIVKNGPRLIEPTPGEWDNIRQLIEGRMNRVPLGGVDQTPWFHAWCKVAAESIRKGEPGHWRAGHAMILAGPAGCGKNRLQEQIITPLLGGYGRFADPAKFLFEADEFNGDVYAAEHLMLSEIPMPSQRTVDRTALAEKIKQVVANPAQRMRLMRSEPCSVSPFWRLTISVNDDPDKLRSLPVITADFADKVLVFHCAAAPLPIIETNSMAEQKRFRDVMAEELPHYLHWLLNEFVIPEELLTYSDGSPATRFGFREYHAPCIKDELFDDTPHAQLWNLIEAAEFGRLADADDWIPDDGAKLKLWDFVGDKQVVNTRGEPVKVWWGRAETLQLLLTGEAGRHSSVATLAKKLFQHNRCSTMLGRLFAVDSLAHVRIAKKNTNTFKGWQIACPEYQA